MQEWQIVFITMYGALLSWVTYSVIQQDKKLAVIERVLEQLVNRVDLFLKTEVDTLKELAKNK